MRISQLFAPLAVATILLTGCGDKQPATQAVSQAEAILGELRNDAATFAPDALKAPEATLAKMKKDLANSDYGDVVADVPKFNTEIQTLKETVISKQTLAAASANEWNTLNAEVPKTVEALQVRIDSLKGAKLPKEISKQTYETAKTELETMKTTWAEATAAAAAGDTTAAADKGRTVAAKGEELKTQLGVAPALASAAPAMTPPAGADITPAN